MSSPIQIEISQVQPHIKPNQNDYRQKRFKSGCETLKSCALEIQDWILTNRSKIDSEMSYEEFVINKTIYVDHRVKRQAKLINVLPGLSCSYSNPFLYTQYKHVLPNDYGYILMFGFCHNSMYKLGPRVTWFPKGYHPIN